jgi:hypothetical protein
VAATCLGRHNGRYMVGNHLHHILELCVNARNRWRNRLLNAPAPPWKHSPEGPTL